MVVDILNFCHYPGFFGYILGLFQYIPTGLFLGSFFWTLVYRDPFFLSLILTIWFTFWGGALLKYAILPFIIPSLAVHITDECSNYIASFFKYVGSIVFNDDKANGSDFPNLDVLQTGAYFAYILLYYTFWKYPVQIKPICGMILLCFVPWSFLAAGNGSVWTIITSQFIGMIFGGIGLFASTYIYKSCLHQEELQEKTGNARSFLRKICFHWWCIPGYIGASTEKDNDQTKKLRMSLFLYKNKMN